MGKRILIITMCFLMITLTGCGLKKNNPDLSLDLSKQDLSLQEKVDIESVEIVKRNTDEKNKKDEIYVKVKASGTDVHCDLQYKLVYNYYTEGGWVLDECIPEKTSEWSAQPKNGVDEETIKAEMQYLANNGYMNDTYFQNVKHVSTEPDYKNGREAITMELSKSSPFRKFRAQLTYDYIFYYEFIDDKFNWWWDRNYSDEYKYNVLENDYSYLVGDWIDQKTGFKFKIEQLTEDEFKISRYNESYTLYSISFDLKNDTVKLTDYMWFNYVTGEEVYNSNLGLNGAKILLNSDGSIDVKPFHAKFSDSHIIKN